MSVRMWGNQYGHGVILDGEDEAMLRLIMAMENCSAERALEIAIDEYLERHRLLRSEHVEENHHS